MMENRHADRAYSWLLAIAVPVTVVAALAVVARDLLFVKGMKW